MKKIILFLIFVFLFSCQNPIDLYIGKLIKVEFSESTFADSWTLTFEDGQVWTIHEQPKNGFRLGEIHIIYENKNGYLRAKRGAK